MYLFGSEESDEDGVGAVKAERQLSWQQKEVRAVGLEGASSGKGVRDLDLKIPTLEVCVVQSHIA